IVLILTSKIDNRYESDKVWSRTGIEKEALTFNQATDLLKTVTKFDKRPTSVLIDEAQFLTKKQVIQLTEIVDQLGIIVMCYGLKNYSFNELFEVSKYFLIYAYIIKIYIKKCRYSN